MGESLLVTGGAGFIGSCFVLQARALGYTVVNLDKLTYAGNPDNLASLENDPKHVFVRGDIGNAELVTYLLETHRPRAVVNFAAESHVDRSIADPEAFVRTNVLGTSALLRATTEWWERTKKQDGSADDFRFLHVSTDEVFGSLGPTDPAFTEKTPYHPNSPYSASKAASDHLARAFHETYGLPVLLTNCSNNYGPRQFPEKLIPLMILNASANKPLPVYGDGANVRDWLHVEDHCGAIQLVLDKGKVGESYNIGGRSERSNLEVVKSLCALVDELLQPAKSASSLITHVKDRPGHDFRYAIDCTKIETELGFRPRHSFEEGLRETILWYLANKAWVENVQSGGYRAWIAQNYEGR